MSVCLCGDGGENKLVHDRRLPIDIIIIIIIITIIYREREWKKKSGPLERRGRHNIRARWIIHRILFEFGQGNLQKANLGKLKFVIVVDPLFFIDIRGVCACDPDRLAIHFKEYGRMADLYIKRKGEMSCV